MEPHERWVFHRFSTDSGDNPYQQRLLQKYKNVVIPAWFKREYSVLLQKIISPIEDFGDDIDFCKSLSNSDYRLLSTVYCLLSESQTSYSLT
ncbi:MAG: hypothetical protein HZA12_02830 [Nitrospirae bacterium]|nr:hypothetical protein [Nitrospirota bacterium]